MKSSIDEKSALRDAFRRQRLALAPEERQRLSRLAAAHLLKSDAWRKANIVALYMAVRGETDCSALFEDALALNKTVLLPVCSRVEKGRMIFAACSGPDDLEPGPYGIAEPRTSTPGPQADLMVIPGFAFDRLGYRLGAGGGYYDRFLADAAMTAPLRVGLCYAFQITNALPRDRWDMPMHALCCEQGLLWI